MIVSLVPSRGRPDNAARLLEAHERTKRGNSHIFFGIDENDPKFDEYEQKIGLSAMDICPAPGGLTKTSNYQANLILNGNIVPDIIGFMGDDHLPETDGWDIAIEEAMVPGGIVYGDDGIQGANLPTAAWLDIAIPRALGHLIPPTLVHLYVDNWWKTLGETLGTLRYLPQMKISHLHPISGKAEWDEGYLRVNDGAIYNADSAAYSDLVYSYLPTAVGLIKKEINGI